eukprot:GFUD01006258.1.p1 GENE.GFUD01006258.1~~GFUD01006258.1.p1  ORF type:complete len:628 (-),score=188.16 GFUD01006258.1:577-2460(-)
MLCGLREKVTAFTTLAILLVIFIIFEDPVEIIQNPKPLGQPRYAFRAENILFSGEDKHSFKPFSSKPPNLSNPKFSPDKYYIFSNNSNIRMWIDVPNSFPWRKCLHEYNGMVFTYACALTKRGDISKQSLIVKTVENGDSTRFRLLLGSGSSSKCVEPETQPRQGDERIVRVLSDCTDSGVWRWSYDALLEWSGGGCLASLNGQDRTVLAPCDKKNDDQIVEVGVATTELNETKISPIDMELWKERMDRTRQEEMKLAKVEVDKVLNEIAEYNRTGAFEKDTGTRRAVVFYVDKGSGFLAYLTWWMFTWKKIGLDAEEEAFDIILLTHPKSINKLPKECRKIDDQFDPEAAGPGQCLFKELLPISERDHKYDNYLNSQECLFNNASNFLKSYKIVIRADLDTFPTPRMVGYWPKDVICNRNAGTTHYRKNIEDAIIETAAAAGIEHQHWHNTDSAWMGPSLRIITLSKLTTYLARFTRVHMFGPGTLCRCATCTELPRECEWGQGIYAGTLLLYAQEIAMNKMWSQREYDEQTYAILDGSCTEEKISVCTPALLHARHNSEPFSKFAFLRGDYSDYDLGSLDITNVRDFAVFMAVSSAGQGKRGEVALQKYKEKENGKELSDLCKNT